MQDPLYLSPLTTCNRNVETLVQRHSCLRSLTSWAKCLRNAPCQCTAHATARADIRLFKSERVPRTGTFSPNKDEISIRNKEPDGYQLRWMISQIVKMSGSKAPDFDAYGLFRATHSHVSAPLRSVLDMCHWHIAPYPIFAYRGIIIPLLCSYRGGS